MEKKARNHTLCEKHPYIAVLLAMVFPICLASLAGAFTNGLSDEAGYIATDIASIIVLIIFTVWFAPAFKGFVKPAVPAKAICIMLIPFGIVVLLTVLEHLFLDGKLFFNPSVLAVIMALSAGISEESIFRICTHPIAMRYVKKEFRILPVTIALSVIFSLAHIGNLFQGADVGMTVAQLVHSLFLGFFLSAVYLRTGSALLPILIHGLLDWLEFVLQPTLEGTGILAEAYDPVQLTYELALGVALGIVGLYMLRKSKTPEIHEIWDKKWSL